MRLKSDRWRSDGMKLLWSVYATNTHWTHTYNANGPPSLTISFRLCTPLIRLSPSFWLCDCYESNGQSRSSEKNETHSYALIIVIGMHTIPRACLCCQNLQIVNRVSCFVRLLQFEWSKTNFKYYGAFK